MIDDTATVRVRRWVCGVSLNRFWFGLVMIASIGGCQQWPTPPPLFGSPHETSAATGEQRTDRTSSGIQPSARAPMTVVHLGFEVLRVDFPVDASRDSQKVWNHVDTLRVNPDMIARLARNGLRVGAAKPDAWPAIEAILDMPRTELRKEQLFAQPGQALGLEMSKVGESESIFVYGHDSRASGKTFRAGEKLITIDYLLQAGTKGALDVRVGFEIRNDLGVMTWERENGIVREVPAFDRYVFEDLVAALSIAPKESLVIGLSAEADNEYLIGSRFLTIERGGRRFETLLFVTPQSFRRELPHAKGGS